MRSESCAFIWHPNVVTKYLRPFIAREGSGDQECPTLRVQASVGAISRSSLRAEPSTMKSIVLRTSFIASGSEEKASPSRWKVARSG
jgi:hypothetical protein